MPPRKKYSESALKCWQKDKSKSPVSAKLRLWGNDSMVCAMGLYDLVGWALIKLLEPTVQP